MEGLIFGILPYLGSVSNRSLFSEKKILCSFELKVFSGIQLFP